MAWIATAWRVMPPDRTQHLAASHGSGQVMPGHTRMTGTIMVTLAAIAALAVLVVLAAMAARLLSCHYLDDQECGTVILLTFDGIMNVQEPGVLHHGENKRTKSALAVNFAGHCRVITLMFTDNLFCPAGQLLTSGQDQGISMAMDYVLCPLFRQFVNITDGVSVTEYLSTLCGAKGMLCVPTGTCPQAACI